MRMQNLENKINEKLKQLGGSATGGRALQQIGSFHLHLEQVNPLKGGDLKPCPGSQAPAKGLQQSASNGRHGRLNIRKQGV